MAITKGYNTKISYGEVTETPTYTLLAGVTEITPPKPTAAKIDTTHFESPDEFRENEPGLAEVDDVEVTLQFAKTQAAAVYALFRAKKKFKIEFADDSTWVCTGFISGYGDEIDREGIVTTAVTIAVSGKPVFTAAGSGS